METNNHFFEHSHTVYFDDHEIQQNYLQSSSQFVSLVPYVNVVDLRRTIEIRMIVPALNLDQLDIQMNGDHIIISSIGSSGENIENYLIREYSIPAFMRSINLPEGIDKNELKKKIRNGVLIIEFKKSNINLNR